MQETNELIAAGWGMIATLPLIAMLLTNVLSAGDPPVERRAKSLAVLIGMLAATLIGIAEWAFYTYGNSHRAAYFCFPSIVAAIWILCSGTARSYRVLGGRQVNEMTIQLPLAIEDETRKQQEAIRDRLSALPHFRETFEGDLVSLLTGDRVFWTTYGKEPCLAIELSGKLTLSVCRFETLDRYVAVQTSIAQGLPAQPARPFDEEKTT
jgi:hypothetical protein